MFQRVPWLTAVVLGALAPIASASPLTFDTPITTAWYDPIETVYTVPTSYSYVLPTSATLNSTTVYTSPTSAVLPTSYVVPTTRYYRTGLFGRRWWAYDVPPTSYVVPTTYTYPSTVSYVARPAIASSYCVEAATPFVAPAPSRSNSAPIPAPGGTGNGGRQSVESTTKEPTLDSSVFPKDKPANAVGPADSPPPPAPAADPADKNNLQAPVEIPEPPALGQPPDEPKDRQALKPKPDGGLDFNFKVADKLPSLIRGRVVGALSGKGEGNVKVTFTNEGGGFKPRSYTTDEQGRFDVPFLPEGDWSIEVEDDQGKARPYSTLTVSRGRVTDENGREGSTLSLSR